MRRENRLRRPQDFKTLFTKGRRVDSAFFRISARRNFLAHPRFAFIVSGSVEKRAVRRNLVRRRAREWIRKNMESFREPVDLAILFKKEALASTKKRFYEELESAINRVLSA
jgi:ribonuclease P protein component